MSVITLKNKPNCNFFFAFPTEIQLLVLSKLSLLELHGIKLICKQFHRLANVDQLWKRLTLEADLEKSILSEARDICGIQWTWQQLLRTATLIERENRRLMQGTIAQMAHKIHLVREALQRQTQVLEDTQNKLEFLSGRLSNMEQQNRVKETERLRARQIEVQKLEDERWMREWDIFCQSKLPDFGNHDTLESDNSDSSSCSSSSSSNSSSISFHNIKGNITLETDKGGIPEPDIQSIAPIVISTADDRKGKGFRR